VQQILIAAASLDDAEAALRKAFLTASARLPGVGAAVQPAAGPAAPA
jgi:hypothetical protein